MAEKVKVTVELVEDADMLKVAIGAVESKVLCDTWPVLVDSLPRVSTVRTVY